MDYLIDPTPVPTDFIRIPASGPKPANTLAFLQCRASGADITISAEQLVRFGVEFKSKFRIDGYQQSRDDWYQQNTLISATGMLRLINTTDDCNLLFAIDTVDPFLDTDGGIGFRCGFGLQIDGIELFESTPELDMVCNVCAYVLLYEPRSELPPSGQARQRWTRLATALELPPPRPLGASGTSRPSLQLNGAGGVSRLSPHLPR